MIKISLEYYILVIYDKNLIITSNVDNLLFLVLNITRINKLKKLLLKRFKITNIELVTKYLTIKNI